VVEKVSFRSTPVWIGLGLLVPLLFVLLGAMETWGALRDLGLAKQSTAWPVVRGVVTAVTYGAGGDGARPARPAHRLEAMRGRSWAP
jgi:hypothetical protein